MAIKRLQLRRDTAANWTSANPLLLAGEMGVETDTAKFKVGNGSSTWTGLSYSSGSQGAPGFDGAAATVAVGTVTTLSAGSSATVTNGGSTSAASLNFGIPAGQGVPTAGTTGQVLKKNSGTNYDTTWVDQNTLVAGDTAKVAGVTVYIQTSDPGAVGAGKLWVQTV